METDREFLEKEIRNTLIIYNQVRSRSDPGNQEAVQQWGRKLYQYGIRLGVARNVEEPTPQQIDEIVDLLENAVGM